MNCNDYEKQFSEYLDGLLDQECGDELRFHLTGCPRCQTKIGDMERSILAIRGLPSLPPRPDFEQVLRSRLHAARTRELYAVPFWASIKGSLDELTQYSRQRTVQLVFATSILVTIAVIIGLSSFPSGSTLAILTIPTPVEHDLASWDIISPIPFESELAPAMAISMASHMAPPEIIPNSPVVILTNSVTKAPHTLTSNAFMTIPTMDSQPSPEFQTVSTIPQKMMEPGSLTNQTINLNVSRQRDMNAFMIGRMPLNMNRLQAMKRLVRPASQIKRIRISF